MHMMSMRQKRRTWLKASEHGFTMIELVIVVIILGILVTVVATTYRGVQARNRNNQRETNITTLQGSLEDYYAETSMYPTLAQLNTPSWVSAHLRDTPESILQDPHWSSGTEACSTDGHSILIDHPAANCYSYQPVSSDGSACNDVQKMCAHYTITAELEGGGRFTKSSLN
jgi:prepilin-type N-terminal cleavage/methylation domain-containing protein